MKSPLALIPALLCLVVTASAQQPETLADMEALKTRMRVMVQRMTLDGALCMAVGLAEKQGREVVVESVRADPFATGAKVGGALGALVLIEGMISPKPGKEENLTLYSVAAGTPPLYATSAALALHMRAGKRRAITLGLIEQCGFEAKLIVLRANVGGVTAQINPRADRKNAKGGVEVWYDWSDDTRCELVGKSAAALQPGTEAIRKVYPASSAADSPRLYALTAAEALEVITPKP